jgi:radical SAM protein (TIGR01212 family)
VLKAPYKTLKDYLEQRFGTRVQRVTLEGGFTCPNRDGTKASGGCTFCTDDGSSSGAQNAGDTIKTQLLQGISKQKHRFASSKFIAYFQSFTNTYGEVNYLKTLYDQAIDHPDVVVLAIGTRPDCVPEEVIDLFEEYTAKGLEVWVDIGVQSTHNISLEKINRAHSYEDFVDAVNRLAKRKNPLLKICTHVILGLAGETKEMMLETASRLSLLPIDDIKIHQLCIFKHTAMEIDYLNGDIKVFEIDNYIEILAEFIARLRPEISIQRVLGEGKIGELIAPEWADHGLKNKFLDKLHSYMNKKNLSQGSLLANKT